MNKRFKNKGLWISVASLILLILQNVGVDISPDKFNLLVNTALTILVALGILNDPTTDNTLYGDDK